MNFKKSAHVCSEICYGLVYFPTYYFERHEDYSIFVTEIISKYNKWKEHSVTYNALVKAKKNERITKLPNFLPQKK